MAPLILPLRCPLCPPHSTLTAPVTLYCGHTVCATHVSLPAHRPSSSPQPLMHLPVLLRLAPCPLQGCTAFPAAPPPPPFNIPSQPSSLVSTFLPAVAHRPDHDDASTFVTIPDSRMDVTVNNLSTIIHRYHQQLQRPPVTGSGSGGDSQTDEEILDSRASSPTQAFIASSSANTGEGPSPTLRQVSSDGSSSRRLPDAPSPAQFGKELLAELSCEICLSLYYQPITSPCQHVSLPF